MNEEGPSSSAGAAAAALSPAGPLAVAEAEFPETCSSSRNNRLDGRGDGTATFQLACSFLRDRGRLELERRQRASAGDLREENPLRRRCVRMRSPRHCRTSGRSRKPIAARIGGPSPLRGALILCAVLLSVPPPPRIFSHREGSHSPEFGALFSLLSVAEAQSPGQVYTTSGYDNDAGNDPICWVAPAYNPEEDEDGDGGDGGTNSSLLVDEDYHAHNATNGTVVHNDDDHLHNATNATEVHTDDDDHLHNSTNGTDAHGDDGDNATSDTNGTNLFQEEITGNPAQVPATPETTPGKDDVYEPQPVEGNLGGGRRWRRIFRRRHLAGIREAAEEPRAHDEDDHDEGDHDDHDEGDRDDHDDHDDHDEDDHDSHDSHDSDDHAGHSADLNLDGIHDSSDHFTGTSWPNTLVPSFLAGMTQMLPSCPPGIEVHIDPPPEYVRGEILRTGRVYNYHVHASVDLGVLRERYGLDGFFYSTEDFEEGYGEEGGDGDHDSHDSHDSHDEADGHDGHDEHDGDSHDENDGHSHVLRRRKRVLFPQRGRSLDGGAKAGIEIGLMFCPARGSFCSPFLFDHLDDHGDGEGSHDSHDGEEEEGGSHDSHASHDHVRRRHRLEEEEDSHGSHVHGEGDEEIKHDINESHDHEHYFVDEDGDDHLHELGNFTIILVSGHLLENGTIFNVDVDLEATVSTGGIFLPLASMQFFLSNSSVNGQEVDTEATDAANGTAFPPPAAFKFDVSNALHSTDRVLVFKAPPTIREVSLGTRIFSYVVVTATGIALAYLLFSTVKHRKESVIRLSQGATLAVFLAAALTATGSSVLFDVRSSLTCSLCYPMVMIPLQLMVAIVIGRLHRIVSLMRPLMEWNAAEDSRGGWCRAFFDWVLPASLHRAVFGDEDDARGNDMRSRVRSYFGASVKKKGKGKGKLRGEYSEARLWRGVVLWTLPMVVVQAVGTALYPGIEVILNDAKTVGRDRCEIAGEKFFIAQFVVLFVSLVYLVYMAQRSRNLPSLFNEAKSLSTAIGLTVVISTFGVAIIAASSDPSSSPDVAYIVSVAIVICLAMSISLRLVLPKLRLVWKGEKVMVNRILSEHKASQKKSESSAQGHSGVSSFTKTNGSSPERVPEDDVLNSLEEAAPTKAVGKSNMIKSQVESEITTDDPPVFDDKEEQDIANGRTNGDEKEAQKKKKKKTVSYSEPVFVSEASEAERTTGSGSTGQTPNIIFEDRAPPTQATVRIIKHTELVTRINQRLLSGLQVTKRDWEEFRESLHAMNHCFGEEMTYRWEEEGGESEALLSEEEGNAAEESADPPERRDSTERKRRLLAGFFPNRHGSARDIFRRNSCLS